MSKRCDNCDRQPVCKYLAEYNKLYEELKEKNQSPFGVLSIEIKCNMFKSKDSQVWFNQSNPSKLYG